MDRGALLGQNLKYLPKGTPGQAMGLLSMGLPSPVGDAVGLLADGYGYASGQQKLTPTAGLLSLAGLIPFVPRGMKPEGVDNLKKQIYDRWQRGELSFEDMNAAISGLPPDSSMTEVMRKAKAPGPLKEVFSGMKEIPVGTKIRTSRGVGTVVGTKTLGYGEATRHLPRVDYGDGRGIVAFHDDIQEVFAPRPVR